jgi:hypothetical protein
MYTTFRDTNIAEEIKFDDLWRTFVDKAEMALKNEHEKLCATEGFVRLFVSVLNLFDGHYVILHERMVSEDKPKPDTIV